MRRLLNLLAALSLLLCVTTAALWIVGTWRVDCLGGSRYGYHWTLRLGAGEISIERQSDPGPSDTGFAWSCGRPGETVGKGPFPSLVSESDSTLLGVSLRRRNLRINWVHPPIKLYSDCVAVSYWLIVLLTLLLPASRLLRRKRPLPGRCPNCHYDLRASADRCPECGQKVTSSSAALSRVKSDE